MISGRLAGIRQLVWALLFVSNGIAFAQASKPKHAHLSLIADQTAVTKSGVQWVGLRFQLDPGWHIYWTNPGDSGEPPKITWQLPTGFQAGDLQFPIPHRIRDHGLTDYGYEGDVLLLSKLTVPAGAASNKAEIGADIRYLVCREVCVPGNDHVSLRFSSAGSANSSSDIELIRSAHARLPQPLPPAARVSAAAQGDSITIAVAGRNSNLEQITDFIPSDMQVIENSATPIIENSSGVRRLRMKKSEQIDHRVTRLRGLLIAGDKAYNVDVPITSSKNAPKRSASKHS